MLSHSGQPAAGQQPACPNPLSDGTLPGLSFRADPAPAASQSPSPLGRLDLDLSDPALLRSLAPSVRALVSQLGATRAVIVRVGTEDHCSITLAAPTSQKVTDPDVRSIRYASQLGFVAEVTPGGAIHLRSIKGIELDVGRFLPWVQPLSASIAADGSFSSQANLLGSVVQRNGHLQPAAMHVLRDGLADFVKLRCTTP